MCIIKNILLDVKWKKFPCRRHNKFKERNFLGNVPFSVEAKQWWYRKFYAMHENEREESENWGVAKENTSMKEIEGN